MLKQRRDNYLNLIEDKSISLFYSGDLKHKSADQSFPFSVNRNFFYLTNIEQVDVVLLDSQDNEVGTFSKSISEESSLPNLIYDIHTSDIAKIQVQFIIILILVKPITNLI